VTCRSRDASRAELEGGGAPLLSGDRGKGTWSDGIGPQRLAKSLSVVHRCAAHRVIQGFHLDWDL